MTHHFGVACLAFLEIPLAAWFQRVQEEVPLPYLDEVFHIPQAQQYCAGHWHVWDSKITTPSGLYLIAAALNPLFGCSTQVLRIQSAACLLLVALIAFLILVPSSGKALPAQTAHHAINLALFPPLFFFSALYYTDLPSTLSVLIFQWARIKVKQSPSLVRFTALVLLGLLSLLFRQTNIFWIAIHPAIEALIDSIDGGHTVVKQSMLTGAAGFGDSFTSIMKTSWKMKTVFDPPVAGAHFSDYLICIASIAACSAAILFDLRLLGKLIAALLPYLTLVTAFVAFIVWNGSVVLGDKSNHVATLHLAQMLYIWPFFTFFSWPFVYQHMISTALSIVPSSIMSLLPTSVRPTSVTTRPQLRYLFVFCGIAGLIVKYNTIVHPFTLADNRHYTFYVFRLLLRPWWVRFAAIPIYASCAWTCIRALAGTPYRLPDIDTTKTTTGQRSTSAAYGIKVSFVLAWLATSSLQLVTAPLVEPRYFILPWMFWRMALHRTSPKKESVPGLAQEPGWVPQEGEEPPDAHTVYDHRLWLDTLWLLLVNAATGYIFLNWKFTWMSEPLTWQRFMW